MTPGSICDHEGTFSTEADHMVGLCAWCKGTCSDDSVCIGCAGVLTARRWIAGHLFDDS